MKQIALVALDNCKNDLVEWVEWNWKLLAERTLICTGTTGRLVEEVIAEKMETAAAFRGRVLRLKSGPLEG